LEEYNNDEEEESDDAHHHHHQHSEYTLHAETQSELEFLREGLRAPSFTEQLKKFAEISQGSESEEELLPQKQKSQASAKSIGQVKQKSKFIPRLIKEN
jgi:hypothetical protein